MVQFHPFPQIKNTPPLSYRNLIGGIRGRGSMSAPPFLLKIIKVF